MNKIKYYTFVQYSAYHFGVIEDKKYFSTFKNVEKYIKKKYGKKYNININEKVFIEPYGEVIVTKTSVVVDDFTVDDLEQ